jgi:hypothetical protein
MTAPQRCIDSVDPAVAFAARCEARALLVLNGVLELQEAVDGLQDAAVGNGLREEIGQDAVQAIMAAAFAPPAASPVAGDAGIKQDESRMADPLMDPRVSLERACHMLHAAHAGRAAGSTVEALMYSLRAGVSALGKPETLGRLSELDDAQLREVVVRLQQFQPQIAPAWSADDIAVLITIRSKAHA